MSGEVDKAWVQTRRGGFRLVDISGTDEQEPVVSVGPYRELHGVRHTSPDDEEQVAQLRELNDALAAKVAEWKARAEKAEAALKAAEDDRHLTTPCA